MHSGDVMRAYWLLAVRKERSALMHLRLRESSLYNLRVVYSSRREVRQKAKPFIIWLQTTYICEKVQRERKAKLCELWSKKHVPEEFILYTKCCLLVANGKQPKTSTTNSWAKDILLVISKEVDMVSAVYILRTNPIILYSTILGYVSYIRSWQVSNWGNYCLMQSIGTINTSSIRTRIPEYTDMTYNMLRGLHMPMINTALSDR